jgi:carboxylesterase family protein
MDCVPLGVAMPAERRRASVRRAAISPIMRSWLGSNSTLAAALLLPGVAWSLVAPRAWQVGQDVRTTSGLLHGQAAEGAEEVSEYLGIPFAKPPVGNLRFAPPQKYCSKADFNATKFVSTVEGSFAARDSGLR